MERTPFAGLTRLGPDDALSIDGYSFQDLNPAIIDALLRVGAITHRHDAHAAFPNPSTDPTVGLLPTGGSIPSDTSIYVGYTLIDPDGGETILNPTPQVVTTQAGLTPPDAPTLTLDATAGTLLAGTVDYAITVTDGAGGESALGSFAEIEIPIGADTNQVVVSGLMALVAAAGGTGWRLWRSIDGGDWNRVATGTGDSVTDDGTLCPDCNDEPPTEGTGSSNSTSRLQVTVPDPGGFGFTGFRIYASLDGTFANPSLLADLPAADFGVVQTFTTLNLLDGEPPAVSRCLPGAALINPFNDIDWSVLIPSSVNASGGAAPAFSAGWSAVAPAPVTYMMDFLGVIHFSGKATKATAPAAGDVIFTLGWAPAVNRDLIAASGDDTTAREAGFIEIEAATGNVIWRGGAAGTNNWISFDGLAFTL